MEGEVWAKKVVKGGAGGGEGNEGCERCDKKDLFSVFIERFEALSFEFCQLRMVGVWRCSNSLIEGKVVNSDGIYRRTDLYYIN